MCSAIFSLAWAPKLTSCPKLGQWTDFSRPWQCLEKPRVWSRRILELDSCGCGTSVVLLCRKTNDPDQLGSLVSLLLPGKYRCLKDKAAQEVRVPSLIHLTPQQEPAHNPFCLKARCTCLPLCLKAFKAWLWDHQQHPLEICQKYQFSGLPRCVESHLLSWNMRSKDWCTQNHSEGWNIPSSSLFSAADYESHHSPSSGGTEQSNPSACTYRKYAEG